MRNEKRINYDSPEAAQIKTVTGWVSSQGHFYGDNEHLARYDGCTHQKCDGCGEYRDRSGYCTPCHAARIEREWVAMPRKVWDGETPLCLHDGDEYFFDEDSIFCFCESNEIDPASLRLVLCDPGKWSEVDIDHWCDDLPEDGELPDEIATALEALNAAVRKVNTDGPRTWHASQVAAILDAETLASIRENLPEYIANPSDQLADSYSSQELELSPSPTKDTET